MKVWIYSYSCFISFPSFLHCFCANSCTWNLKNPLANLIAQKKEEVKKRAMPSAEWGKCKVDKMTRCVSFHYWRRTFLYSGSWGTRWKSSSGTIICASQQAHTSHKREVQTTKAKSDFLIWVSWRKRLKELVMRLETLSDCCSFPEFHIRASAQQPVCRRWHTLESNANCFRVWSLRKLLRLYSLLHRRKFIVRCQ